MKFISGWGPCDIRSRDASAATNMWGCDEYTWTKHWLRLGGSRACEPRSGAGLSEAAWLRTPVVRRFDVAQLSTPTGSEVRTSLLRRHAVRIWDLTDIGASRADA